MGKCAVVSRAPWLFLPILSALSCSCLSLSFFGFIQSSGMLFCMAVGTQHEAIE
jgi:hypothetical protein